MLLVFSINRNTPWEKGKLSSSVSGDETINHLRTFIEVHFELIAFTELRDIIILLTSILS